MKKIFLICFFLNTAFLFSMQWPVENPVVKANFGEKRGNSFNTGISITSANPNVFAVGDGEVIFYQKENNHFSALPSGLGNFIVIEHDIFRTVYSHLDHNFAGKKKVNVTAGEVIGQIGDSGSSIGRYLHIEFADMEFGKLINPLILFPGIADNTRPVIREVFIKRHQAGGTEEYTVLRNNEEIEAGKYYLSAIIYDINRGINYYRQVAPYSIRVNINEEEALSIVYNSIKKSGNYLVLTSNNKSVREFYIENGSWKINLGQFDFQPGAIRIEIFASDFMGNETTREFRIISSG
ncbi:MAG: M23 family metallopeptidase [Spirochaetes bacterium]|nr:M23 family metallopeptidase [Spirochaetota bacterium]